MIFRVCVSVPNMAVDESLCATQFAGGEGVGFRRVEITLNLFSISIEKYESQAVNWRYQLLR